MLTGSCEGLLWDPLLHGSAQREGMPQTQGSLEGPSPKLWDLGASGTPFALGEQWTKPSSQGLLREFWGLGKLSPAVSSSRSLTSQCSHHLILRCTNTSEKKSALESLFG